MVRADKHIQCTMTMTSLIACDMNACMLGDPTDSEQNYVTLVQVGASYQSGDGLDTV